MWFNQSVADLFPIPSPGIPLYRGEPGFPLVVLVHDWYGRLPWLENYATALAAYDFRVAVPDLYSGVATTDDNDAEDLMASLDLRVALGEIDEVIADARTQGTDRIAVVGFSMGGWLSLLHAQGGAVDAVAAYYATLGPQDHGVIPCPVLLQFAEDDEWGTHEDPEDFIRRLTDHGTPVSAHSYAGTEHSFANGTIADKFHPRAAELAFKRTAVFLQQHLFV